MANKLKEPEELRKPRTCFICGNELTNLNSMEVSGPITSWSYYKVNLCESCSLGQKHIKEARLYIMGNGPKCIKVEIDKGDF